MAYTLSDVFRPAPVGAAKVKGFTVNVCGYILDGDEFVALAFAEAKTRCEAVRAVFLAKKTAIAVEVPGKRPIAGRAIRGREQYETIGGELPKSGGYVTVLLHRSALTEYLAEPPDARADRFEHFYAFGPSGGKAPYPIWLSQLRELALLPEIPGWADTLWPEALRAGLASPVASVAGFNPVWKIRADEPGWREMYTRIAGEGKLPV
jgi:hypothetical protein